MAAEPEAASWVVVSAADIDGLLAFPYIPAPSAVSVPVSELGAEADTAKHPRFAPFANDDYCASSAIVVAVADGQFAHSTSYVHTIYDLCNVLSTQGPHQNRNLEHYGNKPIHGHNIASGTNDPAMDATTTRSRKRDLYRGREQRKHRPYPAALLHPALH